MKSLYKNIVIAGFLMLHGLLHGMEKPLSPRRPPIHPLAVVCAQLVVSVTEAADEVCKATILCDRSVADIARILTKQGYNDPDKNWFIQCSPCSDPNKGTLELCKKDVGVKLPSYEELTNVYSKVLNGVGENWLEVDPTTRDDIQFRGKSSDYKVFIKEEAFVGEQNLLSCMATKYKIKLNTSHMFYVPADGSFRVRRSIDGKLVKVYLAIKEKYFSEMMKKFRLNFAIEQSK